MDDIDFKTQVMEDLGYIKAKVEVLEKSYVPCEKEVVKQEVKTVKSSVKLNRKMIFSLYGLIGTLTVSIIIQLIRSIPTS